MDIEETTTVKLEQIEEAPDEKFHICEVCGLNSFTTDLEYETHLKTHELEVLEIPIDPQVEVNIYPTENCELFYSEDTNITDPFANPSDSISQHDIKQFNLESEVTEPKEESAATTPVINSSYSLGVLYQCSKCVQVFSSNVLVRKHEKLHGDKWSCQLCSSGYKEQADLVCHRSVAHPEADGISFVDIPSTPNHLQCLNCSLVFKSYHRKQVHDKEVHNILKGYHYKCSICPKVFKNRRELLTHERAHKKNNNIIVPCPLCPDVFPDERGLTAHKRLKHAEFNKVHKCSKCDQTFSSISSVTTHETSHAVSGSRGQWPCDLCPGVFKIMAGVLKHRRILHPNAKTKYNFQPKKTYKCYKCNPIREFDSSNEQVLHTEEAHKDTLPFKCSKCDQRFLSMRKKRIHDKKSHPYDKKCPECPDILFTSDLSLINHKLKFHPLRLKCSKCDEILRTTHQLNLHEKAHGYQWPCKWCQAAFKTRQGVMTHSKNLHPEYNSDSYDDDGSSEEVEEIPEIVEIALPASYPCTKCAQTFSTEYGVKSHKKVHGKDWICEICSAGFKSQAAISNHRRVVHPEAKKYRWRKGITTNVSTRSPAILVDFKCTKCTKTFKSPWGRAKHEKLHMELMKRPEPAARFQCTKCGLTFRTVTLKNEHVKCDGLATFPCGVCPAVFSTVGGAKAHRRTIHDDLLTSAEMETSFAEDPMSLVSVSMDDARGRINPEEVFVKTENENVIWFKSEMD